MESYGQFVEKAAVLIEALPYIQDFRGATVVIKFGGSVMEDPETMAGALRDIVFMEVVGMKPVIVHGGGKAISGRLKELGIPTRFVHGLRYTCERTIGVVDEVLHGRVNPELVRILREFGGRAEGVSGKDVLRAQRLRARDPVSGIEEDIGFVGDVAAVDVASIRDFCARDIVPVVTPMGADQTGAAYNINADSSACRIAEALAARKLIFISDVPGLLRDPADESSRISTVAMGDVDRLAAEGVISGGMLPKVRSAVAALEAGVQKVHMIDGRIRHSLLLEIFTDAGVGTQIVH